MADGDEKKLSKKARSLLEEYEIACRKGSDKRINDAKAAIRTYAGNQKDKDLQRRLLETIGSTPNLVGDRGRRDAKRVRKGNSPPPRLEGCAPPENLEEAFHNPYSFISFGDVGEGAAQEPTLLTADEESSEVRFTGVMDLEIRTVTPLCPNAAKPKAESGDHKEYEACTIGPDVILPATGVRGALRNLVAIVTGGSLVNFDGEIPLCQGRDAKLGPRPKKGGDPSIPENCFLGRVERPGRNGRPGTIRLGETKLTSAEALERALKSASEDGDYRPTNHRGRRIFVRLVGDSEIHVAREKDQAQTDVWQVKWSGRPINRKGKREGLFRGGGVPIEIPWRLWKDFNARHRHGVVEELRAGDLVWLEPTKLACQEIRVASDVKSLQWARWGRRGIPMKEIVPDSVKQAVKDVREVDVVTDLFGQVAGNRKNALTFAGRIRPENLVFEDAVKSLERCTLSPLAPPHPGCSAFYRWHGNVGEVSAAKASLADSKQKMRGYKIYRVQKLDGAHPPPWLWETQPVFDPKDASKALSWRQRVNKTVQLLPGDSVGRLRIMFRSLTRRELGLLWLVCELPWRLGGGKPLGLGLCRSTVVRVIDETGAEISGLSTDDLPDSWRRRAELWTASQRPVDRVRYPRAARKNNPGTTRGGHTWFQTFSKPRVIKSGEACAGLEQKHLSGKASHKLGSNCLEPQVLPAFDAENPESDVLYGYDVVIEEKRGRGKPTSLEEIVPFESAKLTSGKKESGNPAIKRVTRRRQRRDR